jgi:hypothetical protein
LSSAGDELPSEPREVISLILADMGVEGVVSAAELWFTATNDLLGCPHFELIAPVIHGRFPDLWQRYRAPIAGRVEFFKGSEQEQHFLAAFDAAGLAPVPTDEQFRSAIGKAAKGIGGSDTLLRVNGAAPPEQVDQVEASADAAA